MRARDAEFERKISRSVAFCVDRSRVSALFALQNHENENNQNIPALDASLSNEGETTTHNRHHYRYKILRVVSHIHCKDVDTALSDGPRLPISEAHAKNQFAVKPEGLRQFQDHC